jgi:hypothetical protein
LLVVVDVTLMPLEVVHRLPAAGHAARRSKQASPADLNIRAMFSLISNRRPYLSP